MSRKITANFVKRSGSGFETLERFKENTYVSDTRAEHLSSSGIPLAQVGENSYLTSQNELHCFVIGDSGCGKSRRVIMPSIHLLAKAGESMVISDPKGELYRATSNMLKRKGYEVLVLNFRNPDKGNRWNPLNYIEQLYRSGSTTKKDLATMMIGELAETISQTVSAADDPYWALSAAAYFRGVISIILEFGAPGDLTLENVARIGRELGACCDSDASMDQKSFLRDIMLEFPPDSTILNNISSVTTNANNTRHCILSMFESMLSLYSSQNSLMDLFSKSEIDINTIGEKPTALFFILPDDSQALYPIATVFVKQVYSALINLADSQPNGKLPTRVTFLLDEFANFARLPSVESMLTAARSRGIRFVLVCQSMDQLSQKYKPEGMEILLANCRCWVFMSCRNLPFLERLQKLCGQYLSPYTGESTPLITIDRLQQFEMGQILVLNDRCRPYIGYLTKDYSEIDFGPDFYEENGSLPPSCKPFDRNVVTLKSLYNNRNNHPKVFEESTEDNFSSSPDIEDSSTEHGSEDDFIRPILERAYEGNFSSALRKATIRLQAGSYDEETFNRLKCCIASILIFGGILPSEGSAPVSMEIEDLIEPLLRKNDPQALALAFLHELESENYDLAESYISKISNVEWFACFKEWNDNYWNRLKLPHMALLSILAFCRTSGAFPLRDGGEAIKVVNNAFPSFVKSESYKRLTRFLI